MGVRRPINELRDKIDRTGHERKGRNASPGDLFQSPETGPHEAPQAFQALESYRPEHPPASLPDK